MTVDVGEFFRVSNYNILTGFEPSKSLPLAMTWEDLYDRHLRQIVP